MAKDTLEDLERAMDEATLRFWEAINEKENAESNYRFAENEMRSAKAAYLKKKLGHKC